MSNFKVSLHQSHWSNYLVSVVLSVVERALGSSLARTWNSIWCCCRRFSQVVDVSLFSLYVCCTELYGKKDSHFQRLLSLISFDFPMYHNFGACPRHAQKVRRALRAITTDWPRKILAAGLAQFLWFIHDWNRAKKVWVLVENRHDRWKDDDHQEGAWQPNTLATEVREDD